ncbi:MAG TPA: sugar ABC transporter substrate-binding protein [Candidatus Methylomirabilis sp.]|nr:sugar ABC transporter substrate-binding protein [Candidatus Methylomirabilis sp.]
MGQVVEPPAPFVGRRQFLWRLGWVLGGAAATWTWPARPEAQQRYTVAFANLTDEPGVTVEGTGFTGREIRESFAAAVRQYPIDLIFYDNERSNAKALANAEDAIAKKVNLYILYHGDAATSAAIGEKLKAAGIPLLTVNTPVPGAPLYTLDNLEAGRIAGQALATFAAENWRTGPKVAAVIGPLSVQPERTRGVVEGIKRGLPGIRIAMLDTQGNVAQVAPLLGKYVASEPGAKILLAASDDATALAAKSALEAAGRLQDAAIVSHGVDRSIHGGINDKREIDPNNRGSVVIGSVAFYLDRLGYAVLPLAMRILQGQPVPPRTSTPHKLITAANVFVEYPPYDMN